MGSSSSSSDSTESAPDEVLTVVVAPVELVMLQVQQGALAAELEELAKKFDMPLSLLVTSGCLQIFKGKPLELVVHKADVRARL